MSRNRETAPLLELRPGDTIGILGGGQLGRMLALAAAKLGLRCHVYSDAPTSPAAEVSSTSTVGAYDDHERLSQFARNVDVVTYEFENVPVATAAHLANSRPVFPPPIALDVAQDRLCEKQFISDLGIAVAPFAAVEDEASLESAVVDIGTPAILKTRRLGYDGKGQARLRHSGDIRDALSTMQGAPAILEGLVTFDREISVLLVRGQSPDGNGSIVDLTYDAPVNTHKNGILDRSVVPAPLSDADHCHAIAIAARIADALDYRGVLAVEMFHIEGTGTSEGTLIVNEIAPRVHNSGHWTMDACLVDQFENHIRAVAGWPMGKTTRHSDAEMINLIGADATAWRDYLGNGGTSLHLYGKNDARPGRKMGHVNRITPKSA